MPDPLTKRLVIANTLYGRREASEQLRTALERVERGASELMLICGYSGSGKSSLVDEFRRVVISRGALVARGKFDAYKRDIPYATIAEALQDLVEGILRQTEVVIAKWRSEIQAAIGTSGSLLIGLVPALELLVGPQPSQPEVSVEEAKHRFQLLLQRLFSVIARPDHPLVLFLDDLQWADRASLDVLRYLLDTGLQHLLLLGAYRDNDVPSEHPLMGLLETVRKSGAAVTTILLGSLPIADVHQLLADAFENAPPRLADLSRLVHDKTDGNPFFVIQFIRALYDDGLLTFDERSRVWTWDIERIVARGFTEDLATFMAWKLGRLPHAARVVMKRLACVGRTASVALLSSVLETTEEDVHASLHEAVVGGLIIRTETGYAFPHDSVQEASFASIEKTERAPIHLRIGRLLEAAALSTRTGARRQESVFEAAYHLNHATSLVTSQPEREQIARLDLLAADQAMSSAAFESAATYLAAGSAALGVETLRGVTASAVAEVRELQEPGGMPIPTSFFWIRQVQAAVLFGDVESALHALSRATTLAPAANTFFEEAEYEYYGALALAAAGDRAGAARHYDRLTTFANTGPETFGFRVAIVAAELARLDDRPLDAEQLFELALGKARAAGFVHEEALTCEIAGRFYAGRGLETSASAFRARARSCYERWGAFGKVRDLDRKHPEDTSSVAMPARQLDLATVLEMSKAVSSEIEIERLVESVVRIASEQARAGRGLLITTGAEGAHVEAEALAKASNKFEVRVVRAAVSSATLPRSIFDHVVQTQQIVNVDDGARPNPFSNDEYFVASRARSILCVPLVRQAQIVAVLYLESKETSHAFTPDRIAILRVLAAQAAISLENARLYSKLQRSELYLAEAQRLTKSGSYGWPIGGGTIIQSDESLRIYGYEPGDTPTAEDLRRLMDPEDRVRAERLARELFVKGKEYVNEFWITTVAGVRKRVRVVGHAIDGRTGLEAIGSVMDITAATQAEAALRRTQLYLNRAQTLSHTGAFGWNIETGSIFWSDEARAIYGYDHSVVPTPAHVLDRIHPDDKARVAEQVERVIAVEEDWISEFRMVLPEGQLKHVHVTATAVRDSTGTREYIGVLMDVTAARLAEDELRASRRQYALTLSSIADGVIATNKEERVTFINPVAEALTGWTQGDALGKPLDEVYRVSSSGGEPVLLGAGGRAVPLDERRSPIIDDAGVHDGIVLVFRDNAQRRMAEEAAGLRIGNERLQLALRGSSVGMFDADLSQDPDSPVGANYTFNFWEPLGYEELSVREGVVSNRFHPERWHPEDRGMVREALEAHLAGRSEQYDVVGRMLHRDGSARWYLQRGRAVRDANGKPTRLLGTLVEITEVKKLEDELVRAKEIAETANRAKDDFLANVSHEIRTPMNAILGMTEMVLGEPLTSEQRQWLGNAKLAADSLLTIIDDLLDFAKLDAGKLELAGTEFSLEAVLEDALRTLAIRAHLKGLKLTGRVGARVPDKLLFGDAGRLRQILLNLVGNAIKFTSQGEVEVLVDLEDGSSGPDLVSLRFSVRDTGIGIPAEKQTLIFQAFTQQDASTTRKYGGTGLGLTIASRLASLMSGTISVASEPGRGSTFTLVAPFGVSSERAPIRAGLLAMEPVWPTSATTSGASASGPRLRVLVAEDNEFNADLMQQLLRRRGHEVRIATTGTDAMALASAEAFDVLLLDLHMPGMDGFEVIARLREQERGTGRHLPVIALTARARSEDRERCLAAGMDEFLSKPVRTDALWSAIGRATSQGSATRNV